MSTPTARVMLAIMAVLVLVVSAWATPSAHEILQRVLKTNSGSPEMSSADVLFKLRVKKPLSEPPDCEFNGTMQLQGGRQSVRVGQRTTGLLCWAVNQYVLGQLFEASEPLENFLNRFDFSVIGEKLAEGRRYYLLQGRAKDPNNKNPGAMVGWIDYDRGLISDGRLEYSWGTVESDQRYQRVASSWALTYQLLRSSRFEATMEILYSNFRFGH